MLLETIPNRIQRHTGSRVTYEPPPIAQGLTGAEVGRMLGVESRWGVEGFLKNAEALLGHTEADLSRDIETIRMTRGR